MPVEHAVRPGVRRGVLFLLCLVSLGVGAVAGSVLAPLGQLADPFGEWPWVYTVVPISFLFIVTHPLLAHPLALAALFTALTLPLALAITQPLRGFRYRFLDRASLWFLAVVVATFYIADSILVVPNPYLNLLAALAIAWAGVGVVVMGVRWLLARRARARRAGDA